MIETTLPVAAVRPGRRPGDLGAVRAVVRTPGAAWFGNPPADWAATAAGAAGRWFVVAVAGDGRPVGAAFYAAGPPGRIPSLRLTSVAADPGLGDRTHAAVCACAAQAAVGLFAACGRGFVAADVDRAATAAGDVLRAAGWRCLQPRAGWPTDRFVWFVGGVRGTDG